MTSPRRTVHFVSLGCAKNRVDTEIMAGATQARGHHVVADAAEAEVIIVNTCGFIEDAKRESIATILEMAAHKRGRCRRLIVAGCLSQRHPDELAAELPEVDAFVGAGEVPLVADLISGPILESRRVSVGAEPTYLHDARTPRLLGGPPHSVFVKVSEGCDRRCAFCIIPRLRGAQRSRPAEDIAAEVAGLARRGAREINLVAQDLTRYGSDLPRAGRPTLAALVRLLARVPGVLWLRLHYAYPTAVDDALLAAMAEEPVVAPYLDVPLQHVDDGVLRLMRRGHDGRAAAALLDRVRRRLPGVALRTTFLVGHPGESAAAFRRLRRFVEAEELDHVGVFAFSPEEGTAAARRSAPAAAVAAERRDELLAAQREISRRRLRRRIGEELDVLVDGVAAESEYLLVGRHAGQAPEVDGVVYLADGAARVGDLVRARVTDAADYDLAATILGVVRPSRRRLPVAG